MADVPWRDEDTLRRMYWDEGMSQQEIADELGCWPRTIVEWMGRHDIKTRTGRPAFPYATYDTDSTGYERWQNRAGPDRGVQVYVHRLLAVALYGFEATVNHEVHHKTGIPWDNRPDNIELMTNEEHHRMHAIEQDMGGLIDGEHPWEIHKRRAREEGSNC